MLQNYIVQACLVQSQNLACSKQLVVILSEKKILVLPGLTCFHVISFYGRLHEVLMDLQRKQLDQLSDWLTVTEERIRMMDLKSYGEDFEAFRKQIEEHKVSKL